LAGRVEELDRLVEWGRAGLQDGFSLLPLRIQLSCSMCQVPPCSSCPICSRMLQKTYFKGPNMHILKTIPRELDIEPQCPPKNWETRSWSGDGRRPSGALHQLGCLTRSSLWLLFLSSSSSKCVASLALVEHWLARSCIGVPSTGEVLVRLGSYSKSRILKLGLLQVNSTVSSIELSFLCLDSIESGGRAGASGLGSLPPSLRVVFSFPWLERRGSVRLLGREPPWSGEEIYS
ncbi:unnamed protein product, partial [Microthlaspi erraticum]